LTIEKGRYDWLIKRGYSQKDAAAQVMHNPNGFAPPKTCCIVQLHTTVDSTKDLLERQEMKDKIKRKEDAQLILTRLSQFGVVERVVEEAKEKGMIEEEKFERFLIKEFSSEILQQREVVKIFCTDESKTVGGQFLVIDGTFDDPTLLAKPFAQSMDTFKITNIALLPDRIKDIYKWTRRPVCLWSGNIKIVPVVKINGILRPGFLMQWKTTKLLVEPEIGKTKFKIVDGQPSVEEITERIDRSLLRAEIIYYSIEKTQTFQMDFSTPEEISTHVITLRKQFPEKIIATTVLNV